MPRLPLAVFLLLIACDSLMPAFASETLPTPQVHEDNTALGEILSADQADRLGDAFRAEPDAVLLRDKQRRDATLQVVKNGDLHTAQDYFSAAMVFQHSAEDISLAHALATIASYLDPQNKQYRWLVAASWDRMLMQHIQPQWYGTQYQSNEQGAFLFPVAEGAVTDVERAEMGVPALAEAQDKLAEIASMMGEKVNHHAPTIKELQHARLQSDKDLTPKNAEKKD